MLESGQVPKVNTIHLNIKSVMNTCGKGICSTSHLGIQYTQSYCASVMLEYWFSIGLKENCSQICQQFFMDNHTFPLDIPL